jgi:hypothetical protein
MAKKKGQGTPSGVTPGGEEQPDDGSSSEDDGEPSDHNNLGIPTRAEKAEKKAYLVADCSHCVSEIV